MFAMFMFAMKSTLFNIAQGYVGQYCFKICLTLLMDKTYTQA